MIPSSQDQSPATPLITVVGAGPAGLLTAYRLTQAGHPVQVVEARPRVGGRLFSSAFHSIEFGAMSLGDGGNPDYMKKLSSELGLPLVDLEFKINHLRIENGSIVSIMSQLQEALGQNVESVQALLEMTIERSETIQDVLDAIYKDNTLIRQICESIVNSYHGSPAKEISAKLYKEDIIEMCLGGVSDIYKHGQNTLTTFRIEGGNDRLAKRLADRLNGRISLNKALTKLETTPSQSLKLSFADHSQVETDMVVLALPVSAYQTLDIETGLIPKEQLDSLKHICPGGITKILVPSQGHKLPPGFILSEDYGAGISEDELYLTLYWNKPFDLETFQNQLATLTQALGWPHPKTIIMVDEEGPQNYPPDAVLIKDWPRTLFTQGSYCAFSPQNERDLKIVTVDGSPVNGLFKPAGNIYFAGEAASVTAFSGSVGAAFESAEIAASMIQKRLTEE